jgi:hypothetical protein
MAPDGRVFLATSGPSWGTSLTFTNSIVELRNPAYSPIGINEQVSQLNTQVYPNPSNGTVRMVFSEELVGADFTVSDALGRVVFVGNVGTRGMNLDLSGLTPGLYNMQASKGMHATNERLMIIE